MPKKIAIIGVGAQGSTIAKRMNEDPNVSQIICADYDYKAAQTLEDTLDKAKAVQIDAREIQNIIKVAEGADLIVNGLSVDFNYKVMEAALELNSAYQDMAGPWEEGGPDFIDGYRDLLETWHSRFKEKGLTSIVGSGSSPGLANILARESADKLETVETIEIAIYDGVVSKKYVLFWWSPEVALGDMNSETYSYINGEIVVDKPFSNPVMHQLKGIDRPVRLYDHAHDEPVTMGLMADKYLKGVKNVYFKFGGPSVEKSLELFNMGLLSDEPLDVKGVKVSPFDVVISAAPPAPKYPEEIKEVLANGMEQEEGAFLVRVIGSRNGKNVTIDNYMKSLGLGEAFEISGLSHESYSTGQCAAVFTKALVNDKITMKGLLPPEALDANARKYYLEELAKLGVTIETYEI
ncbi:MAG: hypothetical protein GY729_20535 [Desulfobacteraceae bacterium]|nr:hypothetical protein [Desulfobacteraceae bacterium]